MQESKCFDSTLTKINMLISEHLNVTLKVANIFLPLHVSKIVWVMLLVVFSIQDELMK